MNSLVIIIALIAFALSLVSLFRKPVINNSHYVAVVERASCEEHEQAKEAEEACEETVEEVAEEPEAEPEPKQEPQEEPENFGLDPQIVAVIMGAVEAFEGDNYPMGFKVTRIQRVTGAGNAWSAAGRNEIIAAGQR